MNNESVDSQWISDYRVQNLNITYRPLNFNLYNVTVSWTYVNNTPSPAYVEAYSLMLSNSESFDKKCVCINSSLNLTQYSFTMKYPYSSYVSTLTAEIFTLPHANGLPESDFKRETSKNMPFHCADVRTGLQYEKETCGLPLYGRPRNVNIKKNESYTVIHWDKPCFAKKEVCSLYKHGLVYTEPEKYFVTVAVGVDSKNYYFEVSKATKIIVNTSLVVDSEVDVYAYVPCSGFYDRKLSRSVGFSGCSLRGKVDISTDATCCSSSTSLLEPSTNPLSTQTVTPSKTPAASSNPTIAASIPTLATSLVDNSAEIIILVSATVVAVIIIIIIILTASLYLLHTPQPLMVPMKEHSSVSLLIISSPRTPNTDGKIIRQTFITEFKDKYQIDTKSPELCGPQENIYDWITEQHERADAVFCVCNKYFYEEWKQLADLGSNPPIVCCFKNLFEGSIHSKKYAVVLTDIKDLNYVPPLLKACPIFMIEDSTSMVKFCKGFK